ncbi:MAG: NAD-dependent epimerase/dehydratase family protein [Saprospiraceae bacterium]|nr:NAD-dependent epimerase/dehydratase family protein [Saprospiraceae bacterium]
MKILIIGSKGFIGAHCVSYFSKAHAVWQCDVVSDYVSDNYFIVDATNADYANVFQSQNYDLCINCSGAASVPDSIKNPHRDFTLNVVNVHKQLDAIRQYNPNCKYINFSSAAVYGNPTELPIKEAAETHPISPYGHHKKLAEAVCETFYKAYNISTCSLRIFSAYGPGLQKQLFWDLNKKAAGHTSVSLFGTGDETRDFIYISDLLEAINTVVNTSSFRSDVINVASGKESAIKDVVATFYGLLSKEVSYNFRGEEREGDPSHWQADISKLQQFGFQPKVSIEDGLKHYVAWLNANA